MELRMKPTYDDFEEYEEVESPYAKRATKTASKDRLRTRKNVFNRPFATGPSVAPSVFETTSVRKSIGHPDFADLHHHRESELDQAEIDYLDEEDEEEEIVERRPARIAPKKKAKAKKNLLPKLAWSVVGLLMLRLLFMDRGIWDYFATESAIDDKRNELKSLQQENKQIRGEISRIQHDKGFQRQLAKEHLGVIAADEFLILFAGESSENSIEADRRL